MNLYKRYVDVITMISKEGTLTPLAIVWDNGVKYPIDKVLAIQQRSSRVGGCGMRYTCMICGQQRYLFLERNRFFLESFHP